MQPSASVEELQVLVSGCHHRLGQAAGICEIHAPKYWLTCLRVESVSCFPFWGKTVAPRELIFTFKIQFQTPFRLPGAFKKDSGNNRKRERQRSAEDCVLGKGSVSLNAQTHSPLPGAIQHFRRSLALRKLITSVYKVIFKKYFYSRLFGDRCPIRE